MAMKVVDWGSYDELHDTRELSIDTLGGFFDNGMRWCDYISRWGTDAIPYIEALRQEIETNRIRRGGDWHQEDPHGVPIFEDGTIATFSYRAWGDLQAAIWSECEDYDYCYMDFYMEGWGVL